MKKYLLKSFALLAMLFSTLSMSAKQYCGESMTSNVGWTGNYVLSAEKVGNAQSRLTIKTVGDEIITGFYQFKIDNQGGGTASKWLFDPNDADFNNPDLFSVSADGKSAVININWTTYPTNNIAVHMVLRRNNSTGGSDIFGNTINDLGVSATCADSGETPGEGGEEPDPTPEPTVTPGYSAGAGTNAGANYTYVYTNDDAGNVRLWVTFSEAVVGVAGPQFYTDGNVAIDATTTDNKVFYTSVTGKKDGDVVKLRARIPRAGGLTETPLLSHTVGTESGMIVTEYCNYTNAQLTKNGVAITLSWETADNGDVVITMGNGVGATSCAFRNGGFEGGIDAFVISADNFTTTTPASDYFTFTQIYSGNEARLVKVADLPKGTKIKHIGTGHALSWTVNGKSEYDNPDFIYTYGGMCNNLDAPTNVAITDAGVVTFDLVDGADAYEVHVYQGAVLKHTQDIVSGGTISFVAYADGAYTVKVVAKGAGKGDSEESDGATWNMTAAPLPGSNYCGMPADRITTNNGSCSPLFTWVTTAAGNVTITLSASEGNEGETMFRNNGMKNENTFRLDGSVENFNAYFNGAKTDDYTYTLTLKDAANKPALGSVISFSGQIEAKSSINVNDWSNYVFDGYLYGTKCATLSAPTNVAITTAGVLTFDAVDGADTYVVHVYDGEELKLEQTVASGNKLEYYTFVAKTFQVCVVAKAGSAKSEESEKVNWTLASAYLNANSEYCDAIVTSGNYSVIFDWQTNDAGSVIITISEADGGAAGTTHFRANAMSNAALDKFKVGEGREAANLYFERVYTENAQVYELRLKAGKQLAPGTKIYHTGNVEFASESEGGSAYHDYGFEYTYGTRCVGYQVSATSADPIMGTAIVKQNGVEVTSVEGGIVQFIATPAEGCVFVNWTKDGVEVSTAATYETEITATTRLVANFDYERIAYCHYEVLATGGGAVGKKLYLTLGSNGTGKYYIKFEGSVEAPLASLNNANYIVNGVSTDILVDGVNSSGQDVPFTRANGRWSFDAAGYGSAMMEFSLADGKTISDIFVWTNFIAFGLVGGGELIYEDNKDRNKLFGNPAPLRYNIDWNNVCIDDEAPVLVAPQVGALNATDVQLTLKATDNWDGLITYNISYHPTSDASSPVKVSTTGASAEEITYDILALTTGVEYTFTITASDGTNTSAAQTCVVTPAGDTEKPIMGTATLVSRTHYMAVIAVTATDNQKVDKYRVVDATNAYDKVLVPTEGQITLTDLTAATAYNFTITAIDLAGNESENAATVECTTNNAKPTSAPDAPTHDATKVQSVFCDVYGGTFSAMEGWGQSTQFEELNFNGDYVRYYTNFNYLGWATDSPINSSAMEKLHLDIWVTDNATLDIVPIYGGTGLTTDDGQRKTVTLTGQQWNSIDLTLTIDYPNLNLNSIFQFKFDNPTGADIFAFDNVYFYRESEIGDATPPTNLTATAVPAFETAVISCQATDESGSISYKVYLGAELKGTGSANSDETVAITVTNLQPNSEFTMTVIATDVYGNESAETVDVKFTTLAYPIPAPTPTWDAAKVKSIYSETYDPAWTSLQSYNEGWWNAPQMLDAAITNDNHALYYYGFTDGMIGWQFAAFDATGCTTFTMDIYPMNDGTIDFGPLGEGNNDYAIANVPVKGGQWNTIRIDLTGKDLTKIFQVKMINYYSLGAFFIDNVYLVDALVEGIVIDDDTDLTQLQNALPHNLTLKRNLVMDGDWNTICLPFALTEEQVKEVFGEGTKLVELKRSELISNTEINLVFEDVTSMKASTPYLIIPEKDDVLTGVELEGVVIKLTPNVIVTEDAKMIPVLKPQSFTGADNTFYLGANENLYPRPTSRQIKAMRAYFQFPNLTPEQASKLRARVVCEENEETALDNISGQKQENIKVISNGQLIIIHDGGKYNAQGVKISE